MPPVNVRALGSYQVPGQIGAKVVPCITEEGQGHWAPSATLIVIAMVPVPDLNMRVEMEVPVSTLTVHSNNQQIVLEETKAEEVANFLAERLSHHLSTMPRILHAISLQEIGQLVDEADNDNNIRAIYLHKQDGQNNDPEALH